MLTKQAMHPRQRAKSSSSRPKIKLNQTAGNVNFKKIKKTREKLPEPIFLKEIDFMV
jgi:hypothetical protein